MNSDCCLLLHNDATIGIHLKNKIPASMKDCLYDTEVIVSRDNLVSCRCNCKCGGENNKNIACVYVLPLAFQLSLLLSDGLAESNPNRYEVIHMQNF